MMMLYFINDLNKETLMICDSGVKEKILGMHKLIPIKMMDIDEFTRKITFSYDEEAIIELIKTYGFKYEVAKMYLDNLCYVEDKDYNNEKLDFLVKIKKELRDKKLLKYNNGFLEYVRKTPVIFYNVRINNFMKRLLDGVSYQVKERVYNNYEHNVYAYNTMEEEVEYVAHEVGNLISQGVDISKIKLTNVNKDYYNTIERIFTLFNLKVNIPYKRSLSSYEIVRKFISNLNEMNITEAIELIDKEDEMYFELVKVINKYIIYNDIELLKYKLENTEISSKGYANGIEIIDYLNYITQDDEYIFMLGFNDGVVPNSYKDIDYITDNIREYVGIETIEEKNKYLREDILNSLKDIKNLIITYKKSDNKKGYYPSTMCNYFRVIDGNTKYCDSYSEVYNKIKLMRGYDKYLKYGVKDDDFDDLYSNFKIDYQSYSNKYSGINRIQDGLTLSYSDMKLYNQCSFRYYLSKILKLDIYEENFSAVIGSTVHYVMQKCLSNNEIDTDKYISEYLSDRVLTKKERFFLDKYRMIVKELLDHVLEEKEYSLFNKAMYEKKIQVDFGEKIVFKGIIDKILYYENDGRTYYALIDYKTGQDQIDLKYLKYGLNMQLPIYLYLSKRLEFINPVCVGFYLQRINVKERDYRLIGYSNSDKDVLSIIDNNYDNSKVIKGMKTLKDGSFSKYSKVLSNEEIEDIVKKTEKEIIKVIKMIKNNEFTINPKVIDNIEVGCEYCKFRDICNMTNKDKVIITTTNTEEGDSNG